MIFNKSALAFIVSALCLLELGNSQYEYEYDYDYDYEEYAGIQSLPDCQNLGVNHVKMNGTRACDLRVRGSKDVLDKLPSNLDGLYIISGCYKGLPYYVRQSSPTGEGRMLFFSPYYFDWEFMRDIGGLPKADSQSFAFGGYGVGEERPQIVRERMWRGLGAYSSAGLEGRTWLEMPLEVECVNDVGVNVEFQGEVQPPRNTPEPLPHEMASAASTANDDFYNKHSTGREASFTSDSKGSKNHSHFLKEFLWAVLCVGGLGILAFAALVVLKKRRAGTAHPVTPYGDRSPEGALDMVPTPALEDRIARESKEEFGSPSREDQPLLAHRAEHSEGEV
uniref:Uncharacterized protein n=1 Tax=Tetraselmis sp. GSL018 TaxID=582737 RepID=A0A061RS35_9CHLO|mmetsp:Transcript_38438/g.91180  ORF Transcript_38438/g.91180 Transcript_38438/m.91180 type:complete len:336 (+) Transcript_38438:163-1170(+)|eukprot:CAMPEP_0177617674 /NCGR_PEP_ID=MMETSP0419_2-20121207/25062_1 /TAXON_ID=582737 /ORGANISM="Tetraselmis sp., Strain GSL018" /LENGTH=335 /DNA_ID=CAMNT_0019116309 /DNA_START=129 /DNA_END=1136 /DNA_ORIENTATION=-